MAEEVKKVPRPVDPNSAKYKLGKIAADAFVDAIEAKKNGIPVAWVSSNFPVEIPETLGIATVYPENQAAGIAARGAGERMCNVAEADGYSNDICAYARISMAYAKLKSCPEQDVAMPDVVLCCNNICNCMIKWYENLAQELNVPMIMLDIPLQPRLRRVRRAGAVRLRPVLGCGTSAGKPVPPEVGRRQVPAGHRLQLPRFPRMAGRYRLRQVRSLPL